MPQAVYTPQWLQNNEAMHNFGYSEKGEVGSLADLQIWQRILGYCRMYLPGLILSIFLSLLVTVGTLGLPRLMQIGIDRYLIAANGDVLQQMSGLGRIAALYGLLVALIFVFIFCQTVLLQWIGQKIMHRLRQQLFAHLLSLNVDFFHQQPTGRLVTRLTNDIQNMHEMFTSVMVTLCNDGLKLIGILVALCLMNIHLALLMTLFLPVSLLLTVVFSRFARERFREIRIQLARLNSFLQEAVSNMTIVQLYGRKQKLEQEYALLTDGYLQRNLAQIKLFGTFMPLTEFMSSSAVALILWYGGREVIAQTLTLGELVAFISYMRLFFQPLRELSQRYSIVQSAMASAERIFNLLDTKEILQVQRPVYQPSLVSGSIRLEKVTFGYTTSEKVLREIDCELKVGQVSALVGTTGSGKSTLASLLVRFYDPSSGRVLLDGVDIRRYPLQTLRHCIGLITQEIFLLPDTVRANITAGSVVEGERLLQLIQQTGLNILVERLPHGLETMIGEGGLNLSSGEKQLISFVRVLARDPAVLIFDEATAAVDTESENILEQAVEMGFNGRTVLIIAHRLSTVQRADNIIVMDHGKIIEQGQHHELLRHSGAYKRLVDIDLSEEKFQQ